MIVNEAIGKDMVVIFTEVVMARDIISQTFYDVKFVDTRKGSIILN